MQSLIIKTGIALATCLAVAGSAQAAEKLGPKVKLTCDFPAAEGPQKVKPGKHNVSDGIIRITAEKLTVDICNGCKWQKTEAKWKVTPKQYEIDTGAGIKITISRADGSAVLVATTREDEYYFSGRAESRGQCKIADQDASKPAEQKPEKK